MIITSLELLKTIWTELKQQGKKIVWTNGCFDLLHPGHLKTFSEAKRYGEIVIVWINSDQSPYRATKPWRPIHHQQFRATMVDALADVDYVFLYDEETPLIPIRTLLPDILLKWGDYDIVSIVGYDDVVNNWWVVVTVPLEWDYSTTKSIKKILSTYPTSHA